MPLRDRDFDPLRLDLEAFAAERGALEGQWPLRDLPRLVESMAPDAPRAADEVVSWQADGEQVSRSGERETWLRVAAETTLMLQCQRCLAPMSVAVAASNRIRFVPGEEAAAELDASSEHDVLATSRAFDLRRLVEDELLLAMPLVPLHDICPEPLPVPDDPAAPSETPNPFAALAALKRPDRAN